MFVPKLTSDPAAIADDGPAAVQLLLPVVRVQPIAVVPLTRNAVSTLAETATGTPPAPSNSAVKLLTPFGQPVAKRACVFPSVVLFPVLSNG
jgi:hypothetical protein